MRFLILSLFLLLLSVQLTGQRLWNVSVEGSFAFEAGRWIHDRGKTPEGLAIGWDRGTLSILIPLEAGVNFHFKKWQFGAQYTRRHLFETYLIRSQTSMSNRELVPVSQDRVRMKSGSVSVAYELAHRGKFHFSPKLGLGLFDLQSTHFQAEDFGGQWFYTIAMVNELRFKRLGLLVQPQYVSYQFKPQTLATDGEDHNIFGFGVLFGLRYFILKP
ncbi:MAG: hypothetical protein AAF598_19250 [Bacteroidota bacterium]